MAEEEQGEKTEEPTQHRIEEFRSKGQVAASRELVSVMVLTGTLVALVGTSTYLFEIFSDLFQWVSAQKPDVILTGNGLVILTSKLVGVFFKSVLPILLTSAVVSVLTYVSQIGFVYAPEMLEFKLERVNPLSGFMKIFSKKMIFDFFKTLFKFALVLIVSYKLMNDLFFDLNGILQLEVIQTFLWGKHLAVKFSFTLVLLFFIIAIADFAWEKFQYRKTLRQTRHQAKEESKEKEGNPEIKQRIRSLQREMSHKRMMADVPKADAIIANPTHISVAIKYDKEKMVSPKVIAKGADLIALKIREIASENDVPIIENITLARTLYATVKVGESIPRNLYKAVADILSFVYKMRKKQNALK